MSIKPRLLYVDDDLANNEMMTYWLREECGYEVHSAVDGVGAFHLIDTEYFDLYLLDYCLPDTTAVHLCQRIRELDQKVPIMIYSALDRQVDQEAAFRAGANYFLMKPDQMHLIQPQLSQLLGSQSPAGDRLSRPETKVNLSEDQSALFRDSHKWAKAAQIL